MRPYEEKGRKEVTEQRGRKARWGIIFEKGSFENTDKKKGRTTKTEEMLEEERKGKREKVTEGEHRRERVIKRCD